MQWCSDWTVYRYLDVSNPKGNRKTRLKDNVDVTGPRHERLGGGRLGGRWRYADSTDIIRRRWRGSPLLASVAQDDRRKRLPIRPRWRRRRRWIRCRKRRWTHLRDTLPVDMLSTRGNSLLSIISRFPYSSVTQYWPVPSTQWCKKTLIWSSYAQYLKRWELFVTVLELHLVLQPDGTTMKLCGTDYLLFWWWFHSFERQLIVGRLNQFLVWSNRSHRLFRHATRRLRPPPRWPLLLWAFPLRAPPLRPPVLRRRLPPLPHPPPPSAPIPPPPPWTRTSRWREPTHWSATATGRRARPVATTPRPSLKRRPAKCLRMRLSRRRREPSRSHRRSRRRGRASPPSTRPNRRLRTPKRWANHRRGCRCATTCLRRRCRGAWRLRPALSFHRARLAPPNCATAAFHRRRPLRRRLPLRRRFRPTTTPVRQRASARRWRRQG